MNFPATEYELLPTDMEGSTPNLYRVSDALCRRLVRARLKSELPRGSGLVPQKIASGNFGWLWWALRDDYGRFLAKKTTPVAREDLKPENPNAAVQQVAPKGRWT